MQYPGQLNSTPQQQSGWRALPMPAYQQQDQIYPSGSPYVMGCQLRRQQPCSKCLLYLSPTCHRGTPYSACKSIRHMPSLSCLCKAFSLLLLTCISYIFIIQQTTHIPTEPFLLTSLQTEAQLTADGACQDQPGNSQAHGKHRSPEGTHTSVNRKQNLVLQFNAVKAKA